MRKSRADVEAALNEAKAKVVLLEADLANTQPTSLALKTMYGNTFNADFSSYDAAGGVAYVSIDNAPSRGLKAEAARQLADWLVYHFPKENA